jgi:hypothetical protein
LLAESFWQDCSDASQLTPFIFSQVGENKLNLVASYLSCTPVQDVAARPIVFLFIAGIVDPSRAGSGVLRLEV